MNGRLTLSDDLYGQLCDYCFRFDLDIEQVLAAAVATHLEKLEASTYPGVVRGLTCVIPHCKTPGEVHHVHGRLGTGDRHIVPMCHEHHMEGHTIGWQTFEGRYNIHLPGLAEAMYEVWLKTPKW